MQTRTRFYLITAVVMNIVTFWGFSQTYFAPLLSNQSAFGGSVAQLPFLVHVHGWSFFLWYLLLLWQATLITRASHRLHRQSGVLSVGLVAVMAITGCIIMVVNINQSFEPGEPPLWQLFGPVILAILFVFLGFYVLALRNLKRPEFHKRYMIVASASGLGAAVFRILLTIFGPNMWNIPAGILLTNLFIVAGMLRDRHVEGKVHKAYWQGLLVCVTVELVFFVVPHTAIGQALLRVLGAIGESVRFMY